MSVFNELMTQLQKLQLRYKDIKSLSDTSLHQQTAELSEGVMNCDVMNAARCFLVDFVGTDSGSVRIEDVLSEEALANTMNRVGGSLAVEVRKFLDEQKAYVPDTGAGECGWHFGAYCTPGQAWVLYTRAVSRFHKALHNKLLDIHVIPWSIQPSPLEE